MPFRSRKKLPILRLYSQNQLIYDDYLKDVPLKESMILEKSIHFFNDPEPCHIHRSAVRIRLISEIQTEIEASHDCIPGPLLLQYVDFPEIDQCHLL